MALGGDGWTIPMGFHHRKYMYLDSFMVDFPASHVSFREGNQLFFF